MINLAKESERLLNSAQFTVTPTAGLRSDALCFENESIVGFFQFYNTVDLLIDRWRDDSEALLRYHAFAIRKAGQKAWNAYNVLLSSGPINSRQLSSLNIIEEDLSGTRKIARGGIESTSHLRWALISLLPIQNPPALESVDVASEIKSRAADVPQRAIDAFLSHRPYEEVIRFFEDGQ